MQACKKRRVTQNRFRAAGHAVVFLHKTMRAAHLANNPGHRWPKSLEESLASHPMVVEWSPLLNKGMLPKDYTKSSKKKVWLTCRECGHDRCQPVNNINAGFGCGFCATKVDPCGCEWCLPRTFAAHPMAVEWHPTKNGDKQPAHFWKASGQKVWLTCRECGHDRCQTINHINAGQGCGYCASKGDPCGCDWCLPRTLAAHPMAVEWHPTKNGDKQPAQLWKASGQKVWLTCRECGHERCQEVNNINAGQGCGYCSTNADPCGCEWCLPRTFAAHPMAVEWHPTKNGDKQPAHFWKASNQKVWLTCRECGHERCQAVYHVNAGVGCGYCASKGDPCGCEWCLPRTFAAHPMAVEWHPTKNGDKLSAHFWKGSDKKVWLMCRECGHDRCQALSNINAGRGCGFCATQVAPCGCEWCLPRTLAAHPMAVEWHPTKNGDKQPAHFWKASNQKVWLTCRECGHERCQAVSNINAGCGCGYCSNPPRGYAPCGCEWCLPRTLAAHPMAVEWHPTKNGDKQPAHFWKASGQKVWLTCRECGHDRCQAISNINAGCGCGICINKTEKRVYTHLKSLTKAKHNYRPDWCKSATTQRHLPFDMCTWWPGSLPIIDEVDGDQHFVQVRNWNAPEATQDNDAFKIVQALQNNHHVRRHIQTDVWKDKVDWRGWIEKTNQVLFMMTTPTLCLPEPKEKWAPLLDSLKGQEINVLFV